MNLQYRITLWNLWVNQCRSGFVESIFFVIPWHKAPLPQPQIAPENPRGLTNDYPPQCTMNTELASIGAGIGGGGGGLVKILFSKAYTLLAKRFLIFHVFLLLVMLRIPFFYCGSKSYNVIASRTFFIGSEFFSLKNIIWNIDIVLILIHKMCIQPCCLQL